MSDKPFPLRVQDVGEQGLLEMLQRFCPAEVVGDDAALLTVDPGQTLVVTTDVLVDGVHFSDRTTSAADVGWRAAAANLSDLAAMGATPLGITVGLSLPGELPVRWVSELYQGITDCLQRFSTPIVGGDTCRSPVKTVAITALGQVDLARTIRRSTAQIGDSILVTGVHGASRAGLELLLHPARGTLVSESDRATLIQAHQRPIPRLDVIPVLHQALSLYPQSRISGMDSSDGLADAVLQLCRASKVGAHLERSQIPIPDAVKLWVDSKQAMEWGLYGGEDFELVLCLPEPVAQRVIQQLEGAAIIGTITADDAVVLRDSTGSHPDETLSLSRGFQHF